jgi:hypothetical protein
MATDTAYSCPATEFKRVAGPFEGMSVAGFVNIA